MIHIESSEPIDWIVVFAPLIGVVLLAGLGYAMGAIADWWRGKR